MDGRYSFLLIKLRVEIMFLPIGDNIERRTMPIIPALLIVANVMVFAYQMRILFSGPSGIEAEYEFLTICGLVPAELAQGKTIGLLAHMFLHGDLLHIAGNMVVLWAFACSLEVGLGRWALLGFYVLFGIAGGLAHAAMNWSSEIPLVGASGAIAGLIGAYVVLYGPMSKIHTLVFFGFRPFKVEIPAMAFGIGWFGLQLWNAASDAGGASGVAWYAHIGGFLAGVVVAAVTRNETEQQLCKDRDGTLVFQDANQPEEPSEIEVAERRESAEYLLPPACSHCGRPLDERHKIAFNLARCSNEYCQRLMYLEEAPPAEPVSSV